MKKYFYFILIIIILVLSSCNISDNNQSPQNKPPIDTSTVESESIIPGTDNTNSQNTVALMTHRQVWYDNESNCYVLVFALVDEKRTEIAYPVDVDINITNNGKSVFTKSYSLSEDDWNFWSYPDGAERYEASIYISKNDITNGTSSTGKLGFKVYNSAAFIFDEITLDVYDLPHQIQPTYINLSLTQSELIVGDTLNLTASISPQNTDFPNVTWSSSDNSIATVENGLVKALKTGIVDISASTDNGCYAICKIYITEKSVTALTVTPTIKTLTVGDEFSIGIHVFPIDAENKTIYWESSDTTVVSVDSDGNIVAHNPGIAVITATAVNGISASCSVTVEDVSISQITLNQTSITLYVGDHQFLSYTYEPQDAANTTITWSSSNSSIASVDSNGKVTAHSDGYVSITAKTSNGKTALCYVNVKTDYTKGCSLQLPYYPQTLSYFSVSSITGNVNVYSRTEITKISYEFENSSNGMVSLKVYFDGNKIYGEQSDYCKFRWRLIDSNGNVYKSGNFLLGGLFTGDTFANQEVNISHIKPDYYTLEIHSYS